jgi:hypothetical protein
MNRFVKVPLSYNGRIEATNLLQRYSLKYNFKEENDCFIVCWSEIPLFSISAWSFKR